VPTHQFSAAFGPNLYSPRADETENKIDFRCFLRMAFLSAMYLMFDYISSCISFTALLCSILPTTPSWLLKIACAIQVDRLSTWAAMTPSADMFQKLGRNSRSAKPREARSPLAHGPLVLIWVSSMSHHADMKTND
jgi:hypothetical protein